MATCPNCKTSGLRHVLLSADLPAYACPDCSGLLVSLVAYRRWRELHDEDSSSPEPLERLIESLESAGRLDEARALTEAAGTPGAKK